MTYNQYYSKSCSVWYWLTGQGCSILLEKWYKFCLSMFWRGEKLLGWLVYPRKVKINVLKFFLKWANFADIQVDELKAEISVKKPQKEKEYDLEAEMLGTGNSSARQRTAVEKHREQLRKIEKERKESQEVCIPLSPLSSPSLSLPPPRIACSLSLSLSLSQMIMNYYSI